MTVAYHKFFKMYSLYFKFVRYSFFGWYEKKNFTLIKEIIFYLGASIIGCSCFFSSAASIVGKIKLGMATMELGLLL